MKYIITESQYKKALNEQGPFVVDLDELSDDRMLLLRKIFFSTENVSKTDLQKAFKYLV
jgi:hypothetical protein